MPYHGVLVDVVARSRGPGPRNVLVRDMETGTLIVVPWRNLRNAESSTIRLNRLCDRNAIMVARGREAP